MHEDDDFNFKTELRASLDQLDHMQPVNTPEKQWFTQLISDGKKRQQQRLVRELSIFWLAAVVVLSVILTVLNQKPAAFVWIQAASLICLPVVFVVNRKKQVNEI